MQRILGYIVAVAVCLAAGCEQPARKTQVPMEGVRLADLKPIIPVETPPQIDFQFVTFDLPMDNLQKVEKAIRKHASSSLRFADQKAFEANGLVAGLIRGEDWPKIAPTLKEAMARRLATNSLLVFDALGNDLLSTTLPEARKVTFHDAEGRPQEETLEPGRLALSLKARASETIRGVASVRIEPTYKRQLDIAAARLNRDQKVEERVFTFGQMADKMGRGDLILISPTAAEPQTDRLLTDFFYENRDGVLRARMYVLACLRVEN